MSFSYGLSYAVIISSAVWSAMFMVTYTAIWREFYSNLARDFFGDFFGVGGPSIIGIVLPLLLIATLTAFFSRQPQPEAASTASSAMSYLVPSVLNKLFRQGLHSMSFRWMAAVWIVFPLSLKMVVYIIHILRNEHGEITSRDRLRISNSFGVTSVLAMVYFLLVVGKHSPVLRYFQWDPAASLVLHIVAGYAAIIGAVVHGGLYLVEWQFVWKVRPLWRLLVPPLQCWSLFAGPDNDDYRPDCGSNIKRCSCSMLWINFTGIVAVFAMLIICISSLEWVRRRFYTSVFYSLHVIMSVLTFWASILHCPGIVRYLAPGLVVYMATTLPNALMMLYSVFQKDGGVVVESVEELSSGGKGCLGLKLQVSAESLQKYCPGQFINLYVPSVSWMKSHPFSIICQNEKLYILMREQGGFTSRLAASIRSRNSPRMILDGFHGSQAKYVQALRHDAVVFVAGGVGIAAFVDILSQLNAYKKDRGTDLPSVSLHWVCRDSKLIEYGKKEFLDGFISTGKVQVVIHNTSNREETSCEPSSVNNTANAEYGAASQPIEVSQDGKSYESSPFAFGESESILTNTPFFVVFFTTAWGGTFLWILIARYGGDNDAYCNSILILIFSCVVVAAYLSIKLGCCSFGLGYAAQRSDARIERTQEVVEEAVGTYETQEGRPLAETILQPLWQEAEDPALFLCGPSLMVQHFQAAARRNDKLCLPFHRAVTVYEEKYEM